MINPGLRLGRREEASHQGLFVALLDLQKVVAPARPCGKGSGWDLDRAPLVRVSELEPGVRETAGTGTAMDPGWGDGEMGRWGWGVALVTGPSHQPGGL